MERGARGFENGREPEAVDAVLDGFAGSVGHAGDGVDEVDAGGIEQDVLDIGVKGGDVACAGAFVGHASGITLAEEAGAGYGGESGEGFAFGGELDGGRGGHRGAVHAGRKLGADGAGGAQAGAGGGVEDFAEGLGVVLVALEADGGGAAKGRQKAEMATLPGVTRSW